mmetsp:Transcript_30152/g.65163  ORF Transcript_30152/g.65163 Transcript_30152/m.65163 type:complete len:210 (+) Transcript_30152:881-1510(+)
MSRAGHPLVCGRRVQQAALSSMGNQRGINTDDRRTAVCLLEHFFHTAIDPALWASRCYLPARLVRCCRLVGDCLCAKDGGAVRGAFVDLGAVRLCVSAAGCAVGSFDSRRGPGRAFLGRGKPRIPALLGHATPVHRCVCPFLREASGSALLACCRNACRSCGHSCARGLFAAESRSTAEVVTYVASLLSNKPVFDLQRSLVVHGPLPVK